MSTENQTAIIPVATNYGDTTRSVRHTSVHALPCTKSLTMPLMCYRFLKSKETIYSKTRDNIVGASACNCLVLQVVLLSGAPAPARAILEWYGHCRRQGIEA